MSKTKKTDTLKVSTQADGVSIPSESPRVFVSVNALMVASRIASVINSELDKVEAGSGKVHKTWLLTYLFNELGHVDVAFKGENKGTVKRRDIVQAYLDGCTYRQLEQVFDELTSYSSRIHNIIYDKLEDEGWLNASALQKVDEELCDLVTVKEQLEYSKMHKVYDHVVDLVTKDWLNSRLYGSQALEYRGVELDPLHYSDEDIVQVVDLQDTLTLMVSNQMESLDGDGTDHGKHQVGRHERDER